MTESAQRVLSSAPEMSADTQERERERARGAAALRREYASVVLIGVRLWGENLIPFQVIRMSHEWILF